MEIWERDPLEGADPTEAVGSRHHIVPKFYLERFADQRGFLVQINRDTGERSAQHVRKMLREKDYFTVVNLDMEADGRVEQLLSKIEGAAAAALINVTRPVLRCWPPPADYREALIMLVAFQFLRGRSHRRSIELMADFYTRFHWSQVNADNAALVLNDQGIDANEQNVAELLEWLEELDEIEFVPSTNDHISIMLESFAMVCHALRGRPVHVVEWEKPALITSDEPVLLIPDPAQSPMLGTGVVTAGEVWFPMDPRHLLVFGPIGALGPDTFSQGDPGDIARINDLTASNSFECYLATPGMSFEGVDRHPGPRPVMDMSNGFGIVDPDRYSASSVRRRPRGRFRLPDASRAGN